MSTELRRLFVLGTKERAKETEKGSKRLENSAPPCQRSPKNNTGQGPNGSKTSRRRRYVHGRFLLDFGDISDFRSTGPEEGQREDPQCLVFRCNQQ